MAQGSDGQPRFDGVSEAIIKEKVEAYRWLLIEEADRLAARRDDSHGVEPITPSDVRRAAERIHDSAPAHRSSWSEMACQAVSYAAAILAGHFVNNLNSPWGGLGLAIVVMLGVVTFMLPLMGKRKGRP